MLYLFLFLIVPPYITSTCKVNFICEITWDRNIFIINWLINNVNGSKFYLFFTCKFMFYYLISIKFCMIELGRSRVTLFLLLTFFLIKNVNLLLLSKNFKKNCNLPILCSPQGICQKIQIRFYQVECRLLFQVTLRKNSFLEHHSLYLFLKIFSSDILNITH